MGVQILFKGDTLTALLEGEIDHHNAKNIRETIDMQIDKKNPSFLEMDFNKIQFMDSSGIGLIMGRYKLMKSIGGKLKVINLPKNISRVIKLSGLESLGVMEKEV